MQRRGFLKLLAGTSTLGLSPNLLAAEKETFAIYGAPALPSMIIGIAAVQGQLAKQMDVSLKTWRSPDQLRAGVASGQFKVMMSPSNVGVNLANQGQRVGMINILTKGIINIVSKQAINQPQDLIGKKVLIPFKNDMLDIVLHALLKKLNIDSQKIAITYTATPPEAVGLFLNKDFDAVLLPEPMASASILKGKTMGINVVRSFNLTQAWGEAFNTQAMIPQAGIIADIDYFQQHQEQFELFHQDLQAALAWANNNPQSAAQIGKNYMPAPVPALVQSLPYANLTVTKSRDIKTELMQFYEELMRFNPKLLGGKLPSDDFFLV
ncbi:ABC transporter substrate-binding protein [Pelistega ratti]|nr:ABC transporter substrate-binding protein [Pelistega ratti]